MRCNVIIQIFHHFSQQKLLLSSYHGFNAYDLEITKSWSGSLWAGAANLFSCDSPIFWAKIAQKTWLCERCLNILNHDLGCKFCAQIHIDVAELPIMKHLSFLKLANVPKIKPSRIPQHFLWQNIRFDLDCVQVCKNTFSETILEDMA